MDLTAVLWEAGMKEKKDAVEGQFLDPELSSQWLGWDKSREDNIIPKEHSEGSL